MWPLVWKNTTIFLFLLVSFNFWECTGAKFDLTFKNFTCTRHDTADILDKMDCNLGKYNRRPSLNMDFSFKNDLNEFHMGVVVTLQGLATPITVVNISDANGCDLIRNKNPNPLIKIWRNLMYRYSNLPLNCPLRKYKIYFMRGFRYDLSAIPMYNLETMVFAEYYMRHQGKLIFKGYITAEIADKQNSKLNRYKL